ncbi:DUF1320 domain-containing protein [Ancylobacter defluvii]|uniref:DUF1320 domain-containing protein n=1 Tax=Ancylobacter defluvii TaxID=1282440 RepID=A0A9W6NCI9_9HYPH|nr:DUF1320 domain-containing protein [Ancylobacter defluvii]MBS7586409.1 DUF1320 domain-containing protein [Ancylobacter defluvii]GLK85690.1 hypothetical protein GCM10017653_37600 [Ancylobacter defluvii]
MYATVANMIARYGEVEMIRFSVADGDIPDAVIPARIESALADASLRIDSRLRLRYATPVSPAPMELQRAACVLARFDLAHGGDREPTEQMRLACKEVLSWLDQLATGEASLEGVAPLATGSSARASDRTPAFVMRRDGGL